MRNLILLMTLTLFSAQANAEWELANEGDEYSTYIDRSTIRNQGTYVAMWTMTDYEDEQSTDGFKYWSVKTLYLYDCRKMTTGIKSIVLYDEQMGLGKVVGSESNKEYMIDFTDVIPDSLGEHDLKIACDKK